MSKSTFFILSFASPLILVISIIFGLVRIRHLAKNGLIILSYMAACLSIDLFSRLFHHKGTNVHILPWFSLVELFLFLKFFETTSHKTFTQYVGWTGMVYIVLELIYTGKVTPKEFQPYARTVSMFIILYWSMNQIISIIKSEIRFPPSIRNLTISIMIYSFSQLILLLPFNYLINSTSTLSISIWTGNLIIHIIYYTYLGIFLWQSGKQMKPLSFG